MPFASITAIKALPGDVLQLACNERDYHFHLSSREETALWAANLVMLALEAGYVVPGYMVVQPPEEASDQHQGAPSTAMAALAGAESYSSMTASAA